MRDAARHRRHAGRARAARRRRERAARPARRPGGARRRAAPARRRPELARRSATAASPPTASTRARTCSARAGASCIEAAAVRRASSAASRCSRRRSPRTPPASPRSRSSATAPSTTGRFDLGNMVQAVWSTAHGHPLQMTSLHGEQISRLARTSTRSSPLFAPLWWIWPSPDMLLVVQAVAVALGALPVFWLARKHLALASAPRSASRSPTCSTRATAVADAERVPPGRARDCPLLLFAFWYLDEDRLLPFALFAALAATTQGGGRRSSSRGSASGTRSRTERPLAGCGDRGRRACASSALAIGVVIPHFNAGAESELLRPLRRGRRLGRRDRRRRRFTHPLRDRSRRRSSGRDLHYLLDLAAAARGALACSRPLVLVAALPELALNLLSATTTQTSIHFHYTAAAIPPLIAATVLGARAARAGVPGRAAVAVVAVAVALVANYLLGADPGLAPRPRRRELPGERLARDRARPHRRSARCGSIPRRRGRQRDELARRAPVRAPPRAQLAVPRATRPGSPPTRRARLRRPLGAASDRGAARPAATNPDWQLVFERGRRARLPAKSEQA